MILESFHAHFFLYLTEVEESEIFFTKKKKFMRQEIKQCCARRQICMQFLTPNSPTVILL